MRLKHASPGSESSPNQELTSRLQPTYKFFQLAAGLLACGGSPQRPLAWVVLLMLALTACSNSADGNTLSPIATASQPPADPVPAQADSSALVLRQAFSKRYNDNATLTFAYPDGWVVQELSDTALLLGNNAIVNQTSAGTPGNVVITIGYLYDASGNVQAAIEAYLASVITQAAFTPATSLLLVDKTATWYEGPAANGYLAVAIVQHSANAATTATIYTASNEVEHYRATILAILSSIQYTPGP